MPTYPTYDGRTPLTRDAVNALASQAQQGSRWGGSGGLTLPANATLARAEGRLADGCWVRILEARVVGDVTYHAFRGQNRQSDGSWADGDTLIEGNVTPDLQGPAVEKLNRPAPLGDIVFLSRCLCDDPAILPLYVFEATLSGLWADVEWDEETETYSFTQVTLPDGIPTPFGFSGPAPEDALPGTINHVVTEKADIPGRPGRYWLTPGPPAGFTQPWVFDSFPSRLPRYEVAWCDVEVDVVNQTVTLSNFHDGTHVSFSPSGATFDGSPDVLQEFGCGLSVGNASSITQSVKADALVTLTMGPYVRDILLPGLASVPASGYTLDIQGSFADSAPGSVSVTVATQWLSRLDPAPPSTLTLTGRFWIDYQFYP